MILAQIDPTRPELASFLVCLVAVIAGINQGAKFLDRIRGKEQKPPNQELLLSHNALKERVEKLEEGQQKVADSLASMEKELLIAGEERSHRLHARLNPIAETTASIKGSMEAFTLAFQENTRVQLALINKKS